MLLGLNEGSETDGDFYRRGNSRVMLILTPVVQRIVLGSVIRKKREKKKINFFRTVTNVSTL